ncbi:hypothetical protein IJI76_00340 [Candidatus Saccharibacteria bacterium]|nr:hypothetical protein [Candidatus Saccharibacteria bacterium]
MRPDTYEMLEELAYDYWHKILTTNEGLIHGFSSNINHGIESPFEQTVPDEDQGDWVQAMNAMSAYGVFSFEMIEDWDLSDPFNPEPTGTFKYKVSDFNKSRFIEFCSAFGIDLKKNIDFTSATLALDGNVPIITIKNKEHRLSKINESTMLRILKVAFCHPYEPLEVKDLNEKFEKEPDTKRMLNGKKLKLVESTKIKRDYFRRNKTIPEAVRFFFDIEDSYILCKNPYDLNKRKLQKLLSLLPTE